MSPACPGTLCNPVWLWNHRSFSLSLLSFGIIALNLPGQVTCYNSWKGRDDSVDVDPWVQKVKKQAYRMESYLQVWSQVEFVCYILTLFWVAVSMTVSCACATIIVWKKINCFWLTRFMDREEFWPRMDHRVSPKPYAHTWEFEVWNFWVVMI